MAHQSSRSGLRRSERGASHGEARNDAIFGGKRNNGWKRDGKKRAGEGDG